ncbi:prolyl endopeptidase FAP-like isoform X1 [Cimex lectularius]|uniref:Uncharacterized protein n=1 Tax=Cimex lectularius TaxID=79782 RepID=A0A8I6TDP1_CIMLE|nr:prolyl endopeptidase FAP-like isoform X1 [Cimex lectularius]
MNTVQSTTNHAHVKTGHDNLEELVSTSEGERNWPGVLIALLVILVVLSLILVSTMLLTPGDRLPRITKPKLDVLPPMKRQNRPVWTSRNEVVFRNELGGISIFNPESNETRDLLDNATFRQLDADDFKLSADYEYLLFISFPRRIYKNTEEAVYHLYEISTKTRWHVTPVGDDFHTRQYYLNRVDFAPVGHDLAFAYEGELYFVKNAERHPKMISPPRLNQWVRHAHPDWLYQKEVFRDDVAFWFSPDGAFLAYATFDDSNVGKVSISKYTSEQYPKHTEIPYPKPGTQNPEVNVSVIDLSDFTTHTLQRPKILEGDTPYLSEVEWGPDSSLGLVWVNRRQNISVYSQCFAPNFTCETKSTMNSDKLGDLRPSRNTFETRKFLDLLSSYPQFYKKLSSNKTLYFEAFPDNKKTQRHLFELDEESASSGPTCLTCPTRFGNLTTDVAVPANSSQADCHPVRSTDCLFTKSEFSPNFKYYMVTCLGPDVPSVHVMDVASSNKINTIKENNELRTIYYSYALPQTKIFQVKLQEGKVAHVKLRLPPGMREYEETAFPLLLKISHRPEEPSVDHRWSMNYETYLSSAKNYIVAEIDTGQTVIGPSAALDQGAVVQYLISKLKFIDKDKIGVYGKNYGGYLTAMILSETLNNLFKCGICISSVFSWSHYNSVWTEAWLGTANSTDNYRGYEEADVLKKAGNLKNKKVLIIDSAYDYDVHYQHAMLMVRALVREEVMFQHMTYPDQPEESFISKHFYTLTDQFWDECFGHPDYTDWEQGFSSYFSMKG